MNKEDRKRKQIFISNLKRIVGEKTTAKEIARTINRKTEYYIADSTASSWKNPNLPTIPSGASLNAICKAYGCEPSALLDSDAEDFNLTYKEISKITGLSSKSIAVLEKIHSRRTYQGGVRLSGTEMEDYSHTTIDLINIVLEGCYEWVLEDENSPVHNVFQDMYNAITYQNLDCSEVDTPLEPFFGKPIKPLFEVTVEPKKSNNIKEVKYTDADSLRGEVVRVSDLFHTYCQNRVIEWLVSQREKAGQKKSSTK